MSYFVTPTKLERALRALFILQGKATWADSFISNDSTDRPVPNRSFVVGSFTPTKPYRPEGVCELQIQHHFHAVAQPSVPSTQPRVGLEDYIGDTLSTLNLGGQGEATDMNALADAITAAGRWLATNNPNGNSPQEDEMVKANSDMVNFRCDWVKFSTPFITRGNDTSTSNWLEIVHITAFVSHASN